MTEPVQLKTASARSVDNMTDMLEGLLADIKAGKGPSRLVMIETYDTSDGGFDVSVSHSCPAFEACSLLTMAQHDTLERCRS